MSCGRCRPTRWRCAAPPGTRPSSRCAAGSGWSPRRMSSRSGPGGPVTVAPLFTLYDYSFHAGGTTAGDPVAAVLAAIDGAVSDDRKSAALATAREAGITPVDEGRLHADPYPSVAAWCQDRVAATEQRLAVVDG